MNINKLMISLIAVASISFVELKSMLYERVPTRKEDKKFTRKMNKIYTTMGKNGEKLLPVIFLPPNNPSEIRIVNAQIKRNN